VTPVADCLAAKQRLFVAVPLPTAPLAVVRSFQSMLPPVSGLRVLRPDQLHVTLAFLGEVDQAKAEAACEVVSAVSGHLGGEVVLGAPVCFPSARRARVIALEVDDTGEVLAGLYETVLGGLERAAVMRREKRPFRPHVAVARMRIPGAVQPMAESERSRFAVESVCLFRSELKREGAVYTVVASAALVGVEERES
jgi:RNA 2',3'-cyclic 3'-phosphodiesterase